MHYYTLHILKLRVHTLSKYKIECIQIITSNYIFYYYHCVTVRYIILSNILSRAKNYKRKSPTYTLHNENQKK